MNFEIVKYAFWMPITEWNPLDYTCVMFFYVIFIGNNNTCVWFLCYINREQGTQ